MRLNRLLLFFLLAIVLASALLLAGCGEKKECKMNSDCPAKKCFTATCSKEGNCVQTAKPDCCGNNKCDARENSCGCPRDCGNCTGKVKYNVTSTRGTKLVDSKYATYSCTEQEVCIIGVNPRDVTSLPLVSTIDESGYLRAEVLTTMNQPFNIATDTAKVRITLEDATTKVSGGMLITSLQLLSESTVVAEKQVNDRLANVRDVANEELKLLKVQTLPEQETPLDLKIDFEYTEVQKTGPPIVHRQSRKMRLSEKIFLVAP